MLILWSTAGYHICLCWELTSKWLSASMSCQMAFRAFQVVSKFVPVKMEIIAFCIYIFIYVNKKTNYSRSLDVAFFALICSLFFSTTLWMSTLQPSSCIHFVPQFCQILFWECICISLSTRWLDEHCISSTYATVAVS